MRVLAHWWNGAPGGLPRRDVWVELLDDGRYQVRWRGGEWRDRDGQYRTPHKDIAWWAVQQLISDGDSWQRLDH